MKCNKCNQEIEEFDYKGGFISTWGLIVAGMIAWLGVILTQ